ncbi:Ada metal-binding domain-containing protein [Parapedobacter lycopersici]|uniref:Ada metal-binding domain-containing protein n=1 Tax=Parapedobacter lycopersici TaxID=1864939 RepID=UPI00214DC52F|nr:Ada metal-binding domain-containing protein [Parapedobacter lycopersici]
MIRHTDISEGNLRSLIRKKQISWGGNGALKIYGTLRCGSGKNMKRENRVFFCSEEEARQQGYRPCGNCMKTAYRNWKKNHRI